LNEVKALGEVLESALSAHSKTEDLLLLCPLELCLQELGQSETFHHEHQEIDANLKMVQKVRNVRQARIRLQDALTWSRAHFEKEERFIFPMAEKVLSAKTLVELGERWHKERKVITG
jgi:hemerythrin-like domain-containing protein